MQSHCYQSSICMNERTMGWNINVDCELHSMWSFSKSIQEILIDNLKSRCDFQWNRRKSHVFELSWQITTFKFFLYGVGSTNPKRLHPNLFPLSTHTENKYFKSIQCDNNAFQNHISQAIDEHWMNSESLVWVLHIY